MNQADCSIHHMP